MLSPLGALVRAHDPDRFLTCLFAPVEKRETLFLLYAFNHELARVREVASNPMLALIRLQWWREVVEGTAKAHELATPLHEALSDGRLDRADLLAMIAGREIEAHDEGIPTRDAWRAYLNSTAGRLALAAGHVLGAADPALLFLGARYGAAGVLRSVPALAQQGRCLLPQDALAEHDLTDEMVIAGAADSEKLQLAIAALAEEVRDEDGVRDPAEPELSERAAVPAALVGIYAAYDLKRLAQGRAIPVQRGFLDRWRVIWAGLCGKV